MNYQCIPSFKKRRKKGQSSIEFIVILSMLLIILISVIYFNANSMSIFSSREEVDTATNLLNTMESLSELTYAQGLGSQNKAFVSISDYIEDINATDKIITVNTTRGQVFHRNLEFNVTGGNLTNPPGRKYIYARSLPDYVMLSFDPIPHTIGDTGIIPEISCRQSFYSSGADQCTGACLTGQNCVEVLDEGTVIDCECQTPPPPPPPPDCADAWDEQGSCDDATCPVGEKCQETSPSTCECVQMDCDEVSAASLACNLGNCTQINEECIDDGMGGCMCNPIECDRIWNFVNVCNLGDCPANSNCEEVLVWGLPMGCECKVACGTAAALNNCTKGGWCAQDLICREPPAIPGACSCLEPDCEQAWDVFGNCDLGDCGAGAICYNVTNHLGNVIDCQCNPLVDCEIQAWPQSQDCGLGICPAQGFQCTRPGVEERCECIPL